MQGINTRILTNLIKAIYKHLGYILLSLQAVVGVEITGANGRKVDFAGVFSARPEGLVCLLAEGEKQIEGPWNKFDLDGMEAEHPVIFKAYSDCRKQQREIFVGQGLYGDMVLPEDWRASLQALLEEEIALSIYVRKSDKKGVGKYTRLVDLSMLQGSRSHRYSNYGYLTGYEFHFKASYKDLFGVFSGYHREGVNETHSRTVFELLKKNIRHLRSFGERLTELEEQVHSDTFTIPPYTHLRLDIWMQDFVALLKDLRMDVKTIRHKHKESINRIYDFIFGQEQGRAGAG